MNVSDKGSWDGLHPENHSPYDPYLAAALLSFFKEEKASSIIDLGCGAGQYVSTLNNAGIICDGLDGNPRTPEITNGECGIADLSEPLTLGKKYDWVLSLEVGEHIPNKYESIFLENINNAAHLGIVLSWAIKGQGGYGHVNERDNKYIQAKIKKFNYFYKKDASLLLRSRASLPWFKNTLMVFQSR